MKIEFVCQKYKNEKGKFMYGLKELLMKEEKRLNEIKKVVDDRLVNVPEGTLRITTAKKHIQYIHCTDDSSEDGHKLSYIKKGDFLLAKQLAQKSYDEKIQRLVNRRCKQLSKISKEYQDDELEIIYMNLHTTRRGLIQPIEKTWDQRVSEWKAIPYVGKEFKEGTAIIYSKNGERVRSKSEKIIADMLYDHGIIYKYECPLRLKGYGIVYPDFTFLSKKTYEEIYWEHDGRMDDPEYANKAISKINHYIQNDIVPGESLILTYESSRLPLNTSVVEHFIDKYLM